MLPCDLQFDSCNQAEFEYVKIYALLKSLDFKSKVTALFKVISTYGLDDAICRIIRHSGESPNTVDEHLISESNANTDQLVQRSNGSEGAADEADLEDRSSTRKHSAASETNRNMTVHTVQSDLGELSSREISDDPASSGNTNVTTEEVYNREGYRRKMSTPAPNPDQSLELNKKRVRKHNISIQLQCAVPISERAIALLSNTDGELHFIYSCLTYSDEFFKNLIDQVRFYIEAIQGLLMLCSNSPTYVAVIFSLKLSEKQLSR